MKEKVLKIYKKYEEIINYLIVGGITFLISIGSKYALLFTILDAKDSFELQLSVIISWILAVTSAYVLNRIFVFKSKEKKIFNEILKFVGARIATLFLEMGLMWFFVTFLKLDSDMWVLVITAFAQVVVIIVNYFFSKLFIFKKQ